MWVADGEGDVERLKHHTRTVTSCGLGPRRMLVNVLVRRRRIFFLEILRLLCYAEIPTTPSSDPLWCSCAALP